MIQTLALIPGDLPILYVNAGVHDKVAPLKTLARKLGVFHCPRCTGVVGDTAPYLHGADAAHHAKF